MVSVYPNLITKLPSPEPGIPEDPNKALLQSIDTRLEKLTKEVKAGYHGERFLARVPVDGTLAVGATTSVNLDNFVNEASIVEVVVTSDPSNKSTNFDVEIFESNAFGDVDSIYLNEVNNHKIRDSLLQALRYIDKNMKSQLHIKIDNNAGATTFFMVDIRYIPVK